MPLQRRFSQVASRILPTENLLSEIERVTGGNVFKNLDWLLSDGTSNMADELKNFTGMPHPILNTMRNVRDSKPFSFGMVLNLFSEASNPRRSLKLRNNQLALAKATEMLRMSAVLHNAVIPITEDNKELHKANKISLLCGDFLLARCLTELANLKEQFYVEYMSSALRDLTLGRMLGPMDKFGERCPSKPTKQDFVSNLDDFSCDITDYTRCLGHPLSEWLVRASLNGGTLLGKGAFSVLRMANFTEGFQNVGFSFGKYFALTLRANQDIRDVLNEETFDLVNLAVYILMRKCAKFYKEIEVHIDDLKEVDYKYITWKLVQNGSLDESFKFRDNLMNSAVRSLSIFEDSHAKGLMVELIKSFEI